ncbi:APC family permease [Pseudarthrobacter sp. P1]|uniref:APC family permease n=1 Tax=Pseudarthrobacter sp. P1 TaxID=3418418 RepID=UPI003CF5B6F0
MLQASALLTFATGGATVVAELGREMKTPGRTIPLAIVGGTIFAALLYVLIAIPAAGVLPIAEVAGQPLSVVAQSFMPHGMWLFFILGGAVLAVIGTMNAQLLWGSKSILAAVDDGWFPAKLGTVSKRFGTPHYLIGILYLVGIVPALFHISITVIASAASVMGQLMFMIVVFASLRMRYLHPETARTAPFKIGLKLHWVLTVLGAGVLVYQTYLLSSHLTSDVVTAIGVWLAVGALCGAVRSPRSRRSWPPGPPPRRPPSASMPTSRTRWNPRPSSFHPRFPRSTT